MTDVLTSTDGTVQALRGRINDLDSHEMIPAPLWEEHFGAAAGDFLTLLSGLTSDVSNSPVSDVTVDDTPVTDANVWDGPKDAHAPGAIDFARRREVLDLMGVHRQLVFPGGVGGVGMLVGAGTPQAVREQLRIDPEGLDLPGLARRMCAANNDWASRVGAVDPERLRPVGTLLTDDLDTMMADAEDVLARGIRAVWIPTSTPPGGMSPADARLDPFWRLFADANVPLVLHVGGEFSFLGTRAWRDVPNFEPKDHSWEAPLDPYTLSTYFFAAQNFVTAMLLGGVFDRHPSLRFGVVEYCAQWVGVMAETCDSWARRFPFRQEHQLSMLPSEYLARNVRVACLSFEPVDQYIDRYGLEDVYSYSSDYPHIEGGRWQIDRFAARLANCGDGVAEKFFVGNGAWLLPELAQSRP